MDHDDDDAIRARAYRLWEEGDRAHGQHEDHWRQAEREHGGIADEAAREAQGGDEAAKPHVDGVSVLPAQDEDEATP